jgi:hypothetical protein
MFTYIELKSLERYRRVSVAKRGRPFEVGALERYASG